ncbi:hypothetical protein RchiOBHm_Chr5g0032431 [Rosa chinensis]|uniref:Uncharacterized protein n=1 Tax=Rosa chinensis TaxID=74649 RepID=A0A2P6QAF3_ROSCH|nr:hypothetical protein RchiOBHm_Chr5g0032431 [Rosa chinensis]
MFLSVSCFFYSRRLALFFVTSFGLLAFGAKSFVIGGLWFAYLKIFETWICIYLI